MGCGRGFWGGQRPNLADYVAGTGPRSGGSPPEGAGVGYSPGVASRALLPSRSTL